jgi:hypothetical protein
MVQALPGEVGEGILRQLTTTVDDPRNAWLVGCLVLLVVLQLLFGGVYRYLYSRRPDDFYFPRDEMYNKKHAEQRGQLKISVKLWKDLTNAVEVLLGELNLNPGAWSGRSTYPHRISLRDGRFLLFERVDEDEPGYVPEHYCMLTLFSEGGERGIRVALRYRPDDVEEAVELLEGHLVEWVSWLADRERRLLKVEEGSVEWTFFDFVYFSVLTQFTLGCSEIRANSSVVRKVILIQLYLACVVLVLLVNGVFLIQ